MSGTSKDRLNSGFHSCLSSSPVSTDTRLRESHRAEDADDGEDCLNQTAAEVRRAISMVQHLKAISPHPASPLMANKAKTSVQDTVFQVLRAMPYEFPMSRITTLKIIPHDLDPVAMERDHLEMVLFQLLYRSLEAIGKKAGEITIEFFEKKSPGRRNEPGRVLVLRVSDNGAPPDEGQLPGLLDSEFVMKHDRRGGLLSLFVVRHVAELYDGKIWAEVSERGSSIFVDFRV